MFFFFKYTIYKNMQKKKSILVLSTGCVYDVNATKLSLYYYSVICHLCPRCNVTAAAGWHVVSLVSCRRTPSNDGKLPCALSSLYVKRAAGWTLSLSIDTPMIHQRVTTGLSHTTELEVVYSTEFFKMHFLPIHTNSIITSKVNLWRFSKYPCLSFKGSIGATQALV